MDGVFTDDLFPAPEFSTARALSEHIIGDVRVMAVARTSWSSDFCIGCWLVRSIRVSRLEPALARRLAIIGSRRVADPRLVDSFCAPTSPPYLRIVSTTAGGPEAERHAVRARRQPVYLHVNGRHIGARPRSCGQSCRLATLTWRSCSRPH